MIAFGSPTSEWVRNKSDEAAVEEGCEFRPEFAERVCTFFAKWLRHSAGEWAGKPFELLDWQKRDIIYPLYGWRRPDGTRRFRRGFIEVPKKNGKSTLCSGLSLYHLLADGEPGAEVYCAAADRNQAGIVFNDAANMVESSPALANRLQVVRSTKRIVDFQTKSIFRALAADAGRNEGLKISFLIFDEVHAQKNRALWDSLRWGGAARRQPLMLAITTAGWDRTSICYEQYQYAKGVIDSRHVDTSYFGYIAEAAETDDWSNEQTWYKSNPSLGHTISLDSFRQDYAEAKNSPASENAFRRYRLNQWTEQEVRWLPMDKWQACGEQFDAESLIGQDCFAGLDLASTQDIAAFVLMFTAADGTKRLLPFFWSPEGANKLRERMNKPRIDHWVKQGFIRQIPGDEIDFGIVRDEIYEICNKYSVKKIAKDRWNSAQIGHELTACGLDVFDCPQGKWLSPSVKEFYRLVSTKELRHNENPVLSWMAGNVTAVVDAAENVMLSKGKSTDKIDGIVSAVMCVALSLAEPASEGIQEPIWLS